VIAKTALMQEIEDDFRHSIEDLLVQRRYGPAPFTYDAIAAEFGISIGTVMRWSSMFGVTYKAVAMQTMRERLGITVEATSVDHADYGGADRPNHSAREERLGVSQAGDRNLDSRCGGIHCRSGSRIHSVALRRNQWVLQDQQPGPGCADRHRLHRLVPERVHSA
jgi:hypothetical protein